MRSSSLRLPATTLVLLLTLIAPAAANPSAGDRSTTLSDTVRESLHCLERGEASDDQAIKLHWYERGKTLAESAIRENDRDANAHFALFGNWGRWLQADGWVKNAFRLPALQRELDRTLELNPNHADALVAKGGLYLQLPGFLGGDPEKARPLLERAIELNPHSVGGRLELAGYWLHEKQPDKARDLAAEALKLAKAQGRERFASRATKLLEEIGPPRAQAHARKQL
ncbi:MAG: tetratricopeptide repeat protein [Candidatus Binatia bacterium]